MGRSCDERAAACSAARRPLRGVPELKFGASLDCLRSLPQLVGRDRRTIVRAGARHVPRARSARFRRGGDACYPTTKSGYHEATNSVGSPGQSRSQPWPRAPRSRLARGEARERSARAPRCRSWRPNAAASAGGQGRAERSEASREAVALTAEHAVAHSRQIDRPYLDPYFGDRT